MSGTVRLVFVIALFLVACQPAYRSERSVFIGDDCPDGWTLVSRGTQDTWAGRMVAVECEPPDSLATPDSTSKP